MEEEYLVWSNEHRAWWRPRAAGYTIHMESAGRYTRDEAIRHSLARDDGNIPPEIPVRLADLIEVQERRSR